MAIYKTVGGGFPPPVDRSMNEALAIMRGWVVEIAAGAVRILRGFTPRGETGVLRGTVHYWNLRMYGRGGWVFRLGWRKMDFVGQRAFYAPYVNWGTGVRAIPHAHDLIVPRKAARLAWRSGGEWYSAKSVKGQWPQEMIERATEEVIRTVMQRIPGAVVRGFKMGMR